MRRFEKPRFNIGDTVHVKTSYRKPSLTGRYGRVIEVLRSPTSETLDQYAVEFDGKVQPGMFWHIEIEPAVLDTTRAE
jgi:hypothetical protein